MQRASICGETAHTTQNRNSRPEERPANGEGDTEPQSHGERKGVVFFSLAQCAWGKGREGINYKMVGPWHTQSLGGYFLDGGKVWLPMGK